MSVGAGRFSSPVGLIAGNGDFPVVFADAATKQGLEVVTVAIRGQAKPEITKHVKQCTWVELGQLGKLLRALRRYQVKQATFVGGIHRPSMFDVLRFDFRGMLFLMKQKSMKDDSLLRAVAAEVEKEKIEVFSAAEIMKETVPKAGALTIRGLNQREVRDALVGWDAAQKIGQLDIGQTVIVADGTVVAVEAIEGTDRAILRAGELSKRQKVVVKLCKPDQDQRMDLPAIGSNTVQNIHRAGATALIIEADKTILLDPQRIIDEANSLDVAIVAASTKDDLA